MRNLGARLLKRFTPRPRGVNSHRSDHAASPTVSVEQINAQPAPAAPSNSRQTKQDFLSPSDLEVTDVGPKQILLIGACFLSVWKDILQKRLGYDVGIDFLLFLNLVRLPASPPKPFDAYDAQILQVPLPSVVPEQEYLRLPVDQVEPHEALLRRSVERLDLFLKEALTWSDRIPATFVMTYLEPQQNLLGRLLPRYDIRNPIHFIERLNMELDGLLKKYRNVHLIDTNHIASVYGRRFMQEDGYWMQHHGGMLNIEADEWFDSMSRSQGGETSDVMADLGRTKVHEYVDMVWREVRAAYRTLRRADEVKMVCVDLDNTLWRGLAGEQEPSTWRNGHNCFLIAGWPLGIVEVLQYLKKRGILLAIISKNSEERVRAIWHRIFDPGHIQLEDFAIVKINWRPKAENIAEVLAEANILAKHVVFLDDNPVERAAVRAAFPEIRTVETSHLRWGRVLGWSSELQVAHISQESSQRTQLVQAQVERERERAVLSRESFLASLNLRLAISRVSTADDPRFARSFELINKTNQFNTTGVRWSDSDALAYFKRGGVWWTFDIADRYTNYGLVGVVCIQGNHIQQFVMSCRVAGLEAESAALSAILAAVATDESQFEGSMQETDANAVVSDLFQRIGWSLVEGRWRGLPAAPMPAHVAVVAAV